MYRRRVGYVKVVAPNIARFRSLRVSVFSAGPSPHFQRERHNAFCERLIGTFNDTLLK